MLKTDTFPALHWGKLKDIYYDMIFDYLILSSFVAYLNIRF